VTTTEAEDVVLVTGVVLPTGEVALMRVLAGGGGTWLLLEGAEPVLTGAVLLATLLAGGGGTTSPVLVEGDWGVSVGV
jgi:hypothetical protein